MAGERRGPLGDAGGEGEHHRCGGEDNDLAVAVDDTGRGQAGGRTTLGHVRVGYSSVGCGVVESRLGGRFPSRTVASRPGLVASESAWRLSVWLKLGATVRPQEDALVRGERGLMPLLTAASLRCKEYVPPISPSLRRPRWQRR